MTAADKKLLAGELTDTTFRDSTASGALPRLRSGQVFPLPKLWDAHFAEPTLRERPVTATLDAIRNSLKAFSVRI